MRTLAKFYFLFILLCGIWFSAFSQLSQSVEAGITATIIKPVGIAKTVESEYGNGAIILTGTVKITPVKAHIKSSNLVLPVISGTYTASTYYFSGTAGYTYTVTYPDTPMIINKGEDALQVDSFASEPARDSASDLIAGVFISVTPANVTVSYN